MENKDYRNFQYELTKALIMQYMGVLESDLLNSKEQKIHVVNARRIIVYTLKSKLKYTKKEICNLLKITTRSYYRYLQSIINVIAWPGTNIKLSESYLETEEIFNKNIKNTTHGRH